MPTPVIPIDVTMNPPIDAETAPSPSRQDFSVPQLDLIRVYLNQLRAGQERLQVEQDKVTASKNTVGLFMDYLKKSVPLAEELEWSLGFDPDGLPFMSGGPAKSVK